MREKAQCYDGPYDVRCRLWPGPFMHPAAPIHTTVLLVDDQPFMREGIRHVLQYYEDVQVVAEAKDGLEAIQYARMLKPDVVLMDISMPQMNGVEATRVIKGEDPETVIIGLSIFEMDTMSQTLCYAGFTSYLNKECIVEDLYPTIAQCLHRSPRDD